jgi:Thioredoxin like C-terminal domain
MLNNPNGAVAYRFHARDLHLVMGPATPEHPWDMDSRRARRTELTSTNRAPALVTEQRLYQLIRQPKPTADRQFDIEFLGSGVEVLAFTFG